MKLHAFVAMPFGTKPGHDGQPIDFNRVYADYIRPALEAAGLEVFRADEEARAGDIREDMFQELLIADLVVADLTLDNPNVWYELGVRHALRARGVVLVQGPRPNSPFDIYTDRKLRYAIEDGAPDPASLDADKAALTEMVRATLESWHGRKVSPVFQLLDSLREPPWRDLLLSGHNESSDAHERWSRAMETARRKSRPGDILVLAEETPARALWLEAKRTAGRCLMNLQQYAFALEQFEAALEMDPEDLEARQKRTVCLGRLGRYEDARDAAQDLTRDFPRDPESWALLGRVEKDNWVSRWRSADATPAQMREAAAAEEASLLQAIEPYMGAFLQAPAHYYSGINAVTLRHLQRHLGGDPDEVALRNLEGGVLWSCLSALERDPKDYWARASLAELFLLLNAVDSVVKEYRSAVAAADRSWFALDSTRQTLSLLRDLEFRPAEVAAAVEVVEKEIARLSPPWIPRQVLLFSGHMMDAPDRPVPRFPPDKESVAAQAIARALDELGAGPEDLALAQGAAGGDLLFLEACQARGVRTEMQLPFAEPEFIERSVAPSAGDWRPRFFAAKAKLPKAPYAMPVELGPSKRDPFERCNLWLLYTALAWGAEKVRFICLWNGGGGDGPGGTAHMVNEVKKRTGQVVWLDTRKLW